jgi:uncharacterized protein YigA (DUF484 family)
MTDEEVVRYLQEHPEFLDAHADILANIKIPDPHDGRAIPIAQRQLSQLRERNTVLEEKLHELISFGEENDAIGERVHRITLALLTATSLEDVLRTIYFNLREDFAVPHVAIRLWQDQTHPDLIEFSKISEELLVFATSLASPYCANHPMFDSIEWFSDAQPPLQSFAYVALGGDIPRGILVLASEDAQRFYPEMGTLYLERLGELATAAISRHG